MPMGRDAVVIAGFHRSGTSALARFVAATGTGMARDLNPPYFSNPDGHFEDCWMLELNDALLASCGRTWQSEDAWPTHAAPAADISAGLEAYVRVRAGEPSRPWAAKDPRLGLTLGAWQRVLPNFDILVLVPLRHPAACAESLRQRHAAALADNRSSSEVAASLRFWTEPALALRMWLGHHRSLLQCDVEHPGRMLWAPVGEFLSPGSSWWRMAGISPPFCEPASHRDVARRSWLGADPDLLAAIDELGRRLPCDWSPEGIDGVEPGGGGDAERALLTQVEALPFRGSDAGSGGAPPPPTADDGLDCVRADICQGRWTAALSTLEASAKGTVPFTARVLWMRAAILLGRHDAARESLEDWLAFTEKHPTPWWHWSHAGRWAARLETPGLADRFDEALGSHARPAGSTWDSVRLSLWLSRGDLPKADAVAIPWCDEAMNRGCPEPLRWPLVQWALVRGRHQLAWRVHARAVCNSQEKEAYRQHVCSLLAAIPWQPARADLARRMHRHLARLATALDAVCVEE
jgi:hypothetical protein